MNSWGNLAEHVGVLVALVSIMGLIIGGMVKYWWNQMTKRMEKLDEKMDKKMDSLIEIVQAAMREHQECQRNLPHTYVLRSDWGEFHREWKEFLKNRETDWKEMWRAFNNHLHDRVSGKVVRNNGR